MTEPEWTAPDGSVVTATTTGGVLRPFVESITAVDNEAVFQWTDGGLSVVLVDPANVLMVDNRAPKPVWDHYDATDVDVGLTLDDRGSSDLLSALSFARKGRGSNDGYPVRLDIYPANDDFDKKRIRVEILRQDTNTRRTTWFHEIDPNLMRDQPEIPDHVETPYRAEPDLPTFTEAVKSLNEQYPLFVGDGQDFIVGSKPTRNPLQSLNTPDEDTADTVTFEGVAWDVTDKDGEITDDGTMGARFSDRYLLDCVDGITDAEATQFLVKWGDDVPVWLEWQNTDHGTEGAYMLAPRMVHDL